ncbi:MAG TPA: universal stress protein [Thiobacillaceae bacterium]|nr:universal stress protein [Thiobacillaceae bacterium]
MFKRILVAVDGSHTAEQALQQAIKLAKEVQAQLRIVHAVDIVNINLSAEFPNPAKISDAITESGREILRKAEVVARAAGIPVETQLIEIDTWGHRVPEMIAADAEAWPADLIVICTHGRRGLSHLFLGSVAEGLVRVATKPVLLIRGK